MPQFRERDPTIAALDPAHHERPGRTRRTSEVALRLGRCEQVTPVTTVGCLDESSSARLVTRLERRLDVLECSSPPTWSALRPGRFIPVHRVPRAELAVVASFSTSWAEGDAWLCHAVCDAVTHRLWETATFWDRDDDSAALLPDLHAHVSSELARLRDELELPSSMPSAMPPWWAAMIATPHHLWMLGEGEARVHLVRSDGHLRKIERHDGGLLARVVRQEVDYAAIALGDACDRLDAPLVARHLQRDDTLGGIVSAIVDSTHAAGATHGAWVVARLVEPA
jgi:hypothetical protein